MKILELRFKNLNSLYGEWSIDFASPEYGANGIFALTGPTGAGKSTILDAICLALYGATPRLGKITKSSNEIMSRQTGECFAEVTFESLSGTFRCHWSQHRARKKADGKLAESKHEFVDANSDQVLESKKRYVAEMVEQKTGMDFERFTRSILLAQGGFDTFLKADAEQKSKILEQITGTGIYTEISKRVHENQREERGKLNVLMAETSGIELLSDEHLVEIKASLAKNQKKETEVTTQVKDVEKSISWIKGLDGLRKEINDLAEESKQIDLAIEKFKPEQERLNLALQASELDGLYATLRSVRKQQGEDTHRLKKTGENLPKFEQTVEKKELEFDGVEKSVLRKKAELKKAGATFQKVRTLDQQLKDKQQLMKAGKDEYNRIAGQLALQQQQLEHSGESHKKVKKNLENVQVYLQKNRQDESLLAGLGVVEEQLNTLVKSQDEITIKSKLLSDIDKQHAVTRTKLTSLSKNVELEKANLKNIQQTKDFESKSLDTHLAGRLLREYRAEKDGLLKEVAYLNKIANLEAERSQLQDGKPCPLCGSEDHPYAEGNIPVVDETQKKIDILEVFIPRCEKQEQNIQKQQQLEKQSVENLTTLEKNEAKYANELNTLVKQRTDTDSEIRQKRSALNDLKTQLLARLMPLGVQELPEGDLLPLLHALKGRLVKWQDNQVRKEVLEKQLLELEADIKSIDAVIKTQNEDLIVRQGSLKKMSADFEFLMAERNQLFGEKNPDIEEKLLNKAIVEGEEKEKSFRMVRDEAKQALHATKVNIQALQKNIDGRVGELQKLESDFEADLAQHHFIDEKTFLSSCIPKEEHEQLINQAKMLNDQFASLHTKRKDRQGRLEAESEKKVTVLTLEELEPLHKDFQNDLVLLTENIHGLRSRVSANETAGAKIKEKQAVIDLQKVECVKWDKLHSLIGSADGKKFRNFAQGLTFQLMVSHANRQLEKMTDRYLLIRDEDQPLELNVVDNYQGGEIRSTRNLSGGESFVVSLTLALGLSKMASRKVRVDSLFLDEGFGTLDEEALETALETLAGLQQDGKLIGIISHVPALKERISTQITVHPQSGGKSLVAGPGCEKVA